MKVVSKKIDYILRFELVCVLLINVATVFKIDAVVSAAFLLTFISTFIAFILYLEAKEYRIDANIALVVIGVLLSIASVIMTASGAISFDYFKKIIIFMSTMLFLLVVGNTRVSQATKNWIIATVFSIAFVYIAAYYLLSIRPIHKKSLLLSMNYTNPNLFAMWLCIIIILLAVSIFYLRNIMSRFLAIVFIALLIPLAFKCGARNIIIPIVSFVVLPFVIRKGNKGIIISIVALLFPIIFLCIYMSFITVFIKSSFFDFLISTGKGLDSRYEVWQELVAVFKDNFIFGNYYLISNGTGVSQCLNTHLDILCSYGIGTYICTIVPMISIFVHNKRKYVNSVKTVVCYSALLGITLTGIGEAALFSGGIGIYIMAFIGFTLLSDDEQHEAHTR